MRVFLVPVAMAVVAAGCSEQTTAAVHPEQALAALAPASLAAADAVPAQGRDFIAALHGRAEVPPVSTDAVGTTGFRLSNDGTSLRFMLMVARIDDLNMAHIHLAPPGENGGVVAWLYPSSPPPVPIPGEFNGVLSEGQITADHLVGALAGQPLSALIEEMRAGNTYVNVHTAQFPGGEIRGQIVEFNRID